MSVGLTNPLANGRTFAAEDGVVDFANGFQTTITTTTRTAPTAFAARTSSRRPVKRPRGLRREPTGPAESAAAPRGGMRARRAARRSIARSTRTAVATPGRTYDGSRTA